MELLTKKIISSIPNKNQTQNDSFVVISDPSLIKSALIERKKSSDSVRSRTSSVSSLKKNNTFDFNSLSEPGYFKEFFESHLFVNAHSNIINHILENFSIPCQYDESFLDFLTSKRDLGLIEKYCSKNCNEFTVFKLLKHVFELLGESSLENFTSLGYQSYIAKRGNEIDDYKKLYLLSLIFTKNIDRNILVKEFKSNIEPKLAIDMFYALVAIISDYRDEESDGLMCDLKSLNNLYLWLGLITDSLMLMCIKSILSPKTIDAIKEEIVEVLSVIEGQIAYFKAHQSLETSFEILSSSYVKYLKCSAKDDLKIESLMI